MFTNKARSGWTLLGLRHDRPFHRSYSAFQYLIKSCTSLRTSRRAEKLTDKLLIKSCTSLRTSRRAEKLTVQTLQSRQTLDSQNDKTGLLTTDSVCVLVRAIEKDKSFALIRTDDNDDTVLVPR